MLIKTYDINTFPWYFLSIYKILQGEFQGTAYCNWIKEDNLYGFKSPCFVSNHELFQVCIASKYKLQNLLSKWDHLDAFPLHKSRNNKSWYKRRIINNGLYSFIVYKGRSPYFLLEQKAYIFIKETALTISLSVFLYIIPMGVVNFTHNWIWGPVVISQVRYDSTYIHCVVLFTFLLLNRMLKSFTPATNDQFKCIYVYFLQKQVCCWFHTRNNWARSEPIYVNNDCFWVWKNEW